MPAVDAGFVRESTAVNSLMAVCTPATAAIFRSGFKGFFRNGAGSFKAAFLAGGVAWGGFRPLGGCALDQAASMGRITNVM